MGLDEAIVRFGVSERDAELLNGIIPSVCQLILQNPFSERIVHLLNNQDLAEKEVVNTMKEMSKPNCIGTAFYIAGVCEFPYHAYDFELNPHMKETEEAKGMFRFASFMNPHIERRVPGAFIFSYCVESDGWHAGIYLGAVGDEHIAFAQHGHGSKFGPEALRNNYSSPKYYIPQTLKKA